jgi:NADPH2:quinone reductase
VSGPGFEPGQRVAGVGPYGNAAELVASPAMSTFPLPDALSFDEGAALPMNYLTAQFALAERGDVRAGETVLVHGAAGGVGTATIQVAKGYGARTIAVVSTEEKGDVARAAGADEVVLLDGFKDAVAELTEGNGVDIVMDVVGGDVFTDSLRSLASQGRLLVVGFAAGQGIPEVKVNRLLLNNVDVRGVGWGAYAMVRPGFMQDQWRALVPMIESGVVRPPVGATYDFTDFGKALLDLDQRRALGKLVVRVR